MAAAAPAFADFAAGQAAYERGDFAGARQAWRPLAEQGDADARFVMRHLSETRAVPRNRLFELFPYGYPEQACKIAGMRRPRVWSIG